MTCCPVITALAPLILIETLFLDLDETEAEDNASKDVGGGGRSLFATCLQMVSGKSGGQVVSDVIPLGFAAAACTSGFVKK